ncbi:MAG: hypothetical protein WB558_24260 [Terriglobales bacterium]
MTTLGEFNEIVLDETMRRIKKRLAPSGKDNKGVKVVATEENSFVYVRWRAMSNEGRWVKYGIDVEKAIDSMVRAGALAYLEESSPNSKGEDKWETDKSWIRIVGLKRFLESAE